MHHDIVAGQGKDRASAVDGTRYPGNRPDSTDVRRCQKANRVAHMSESGGSRFNLHDQNRVSIFASCLSLQVCSKIRQLTDHLVVKRTCYCQKLPDWFLCGFQFGLFLSTGHAGKQTQTCQQHRSQRNVSHL